MMKFKKGFYFMSTYDVKKPPKKEALDKHNNK